MGTKGTKRDIGGHGNRSEKRGMGNKGNIGW